MKKKKKLCGFILIILSFILLSGSYYIKRKVKAGQEQVFDVEHKEELGDKVMSIIPETKNFEDQLSSPIQEKLKEGKEQIVFYTKLANWLNVFGIIFLVLGFGTFLGAEKKK